MKLTRCQAVTPSHSMYVPILMARRLTQEARKEDSPIKGIPFSWNKNIIINPYMQLKGIIIHNVWIKTFLLTEIVSYIHIYI